MPAGRQTPLPPGDQLASDRERDHITDILKEAFAEGRLTSDELTARAASASTARTRSQLAALVADIPLTSAAGAPAAQPGPQAGARGVTILAAISLALAVITFAYPAPLAMALGVVLAAIALLRPRHGRKAPLYMAIAGLFLPIIGYLLGIALW